MRAGAPMLRLVGLDPIGDIAEWRGNVTIGSAVGYGCIRQRTSV
jgi:hypothetical protein